MRMNVARRLSEAVGSWLHLEFCCYRAGLLSESSLKSAVGSVLSSFPVKTDGARVHAEFPHAALNPASRRGRNREVDFALVFTNPEHPRNGAEVLVEVKWADSSHCTPVKIAKDFLRLAILKSAEPNAICVFILAGNHKSIERTLSQAPFVTTGVQNRGISSKQAQERRFKLKHSDFPDADRLHLSKAIKNLALAGCNIPDSFVTCAHGLHPVATTKGAVDFQAIAWEVKDVSSEFVDPTIW